MVILLVFGKKAEPATLILHGNDGQTWFSIVDNSLQQADVKLITAIQHALEIETLVPVSHS